MQKSRLGEEEGKKKKRSTFKKKIRFINKEIINAFLAKCSGHYIKEVKVSIEREREKPTKTI